MTEFLPRSAWTNDPYPSGATMLVESEVLGVALHWPGDSGSISGDRDSVIRRLQGELVFHTRPVSQGGRGWSDIAYNVAVDQAGRAWDLRGITRRSAANGDVDVNRQYVAVTCLVGAKDTPTPALLQAVRDVRARVLARFPRATRVVPHSAIRPDPTDCPGDRIRAHIAAGTFTSTKEIEMATLDADDKAAIQAAARAAIVDYFEHGPTRNFGDGADSPPLRLLEWAAREARAGRVAGQDARAAALALAGQVAALDQVDEQALAAQLAPLLAQALPTQIVHFTDEDLAAIAKACADETARRQVA